MSLNSYQSSHVASLHSFQNPLKQTTRRINPKQLLRHTTLHPKLLLQLHPKLYKTTSKTILKLPQNYQTTTNTLPQHYHKKTTFETTPPNYKTTTYTQAASFKTQGGQLSLQTPVQENSSQYTSESTMQNVVHCELGTS